MGHKNLIDGVGYDTTGGRCLVGGVGYSIQKGRTLVDGVGYDVAFGVNGTPVGELAVGSSVYTNVNGVRTEFLVVHQGNPSSSLYDASCDGTWLLIKNIYEKRKIGSSGNTSYKDSAIHTYLNSTFNGLFDSYVDKIIKTIKIPYAAGNGSSKIYNGSNGLAAKFFLLSTKETGITGSSYLNDGASLSYFSGATNAIRLAYYSGTASSWWLRSPSTSTTTMMNTISKSGGASSGNTDASAGIRPACVILPETLIDPNTFDILG